MTKYSGYVVQIGAEAFGVLALNIPKGPKVVPFWDYLIDYRLLNMNPQKELLWGLWVSQTLDLNSETQKPYTKNPSLNPKP